ncbi:MAG: helix-turn-helix domain-containing protein [Candidatus Binataceae bacterium]|nr:helix-turn-helix domain-containing protein [Candidatus Binataceae bacterium]
MVNAMSMLMEIVDTIGDDAALKLIADFAGTRLYVPQEPNPEDPISRSIGLPAAQKLARLYGGDRMDVPNPAVRRMRILQMRAAGATVESIARELRCTARRVYQVLAEARTVSPSL